MRLTVPDKAYYVTGDGTVGCLDGVTWFNFACGAPDAYPCFTLKLEALLDGRDRVKANLAALEAAITEEAKK